MEADGATFDQDGTLWVEHPIYAQGMFALDRLRVLAGQQPDWATREPFRAILSGDAEVGALDEHEWAEIIGITKSNVGVKLNRIKAKLEKLLTPVYDEIR